MCYNLNKAVVQGYYSIEKKYFSLSEDDKKRFYYEIRDLYNSQKKEFDFFEF